MPWTKQQLREMDEARLTKSVVKPLFEAMGYHDVRYHHGGMELGKDLILWKEDDFGNRIDHAVVVKAKRITGKTESTIAPIAAQIRQCFSTPYRDVSTTEERSVRRCVLLSSHEITKEAREALRASLSAERMNSTTIVDGDKLLDHIKEHLPQDYLLHSLQEAAVMWAKLNAKHGFEFKVGKDQVVMTVYPEGPDADPMPASFETRFGKSKKGEEAREKFLRYLEHGKPVTLDSEFLQVSLPEDLQRFVPAEGQITLVPPADRPPFSAICSFELVDSQGTILYVFPYLDLRMAYGGTKTATLTNREQPIPLQIEVVVPLQLGEKGNVRFNWDTAKQNIFSYVQSLEFMEKAQEAAGFVLRDFLTGQELMRADVQTETSEVVDPGHLEFAKVVLRIQQKTGALIQTPDGPFPEDEDIHAAVRLRQILEEGRLVGDGIDLRMKASGVERLLSNHPDGVIGEFRGRHEEDRLSIFNTTIPLGPSEVTCPKARIEPKDLPSLREALDRGEEWINVHFVPEPGNQIVAVFERWTETEEDDDTHS